MKRLFFFLLKSALFSLVLILAPHAHAVVNYGGGYYTNLCGSGTRDLATTNLCNKGCDTNSGQCTSDRPYVVKWTCDGNLTECRNNETDFAKSQSVLGAACGKTVQLNVFKKKCRNFLGWLCSESDLEDFMVWYSGDCAGTAPNVSVTPTSTPTQSSYTSSCDGLSVSAGYGSLVPATVTLQARGSDTNGAITKYRFFFGDGKNEEATTSQIQHRYESSGTFTSRVDIRDSKGVWKTSTSCQTTVMVQSLPVESQKSDCSDLFVLSGNPVQPQMTSTFLVTGFDNKGSLKRYKIDFGNSVTKEGDNGSFEHVYDTSGTYTIRGWVQDSQSAWKGGSGSCEKTLYVSTKPLGSQPGTGTPTMFTVIALASGIMGAGILASYFQSQLYLNHDTTSKRRIKRH